MKLGLLGNNGFLGSVGLEAGFRLETVFKTGLESELASKLAFGVTEIVGTDILLENDSNECVDIGVELPVIGRVD